MNVNKTRIREHVQDFAFEALFIEELGWDYPSAPKLEIPYGDDYIILTAVAAKRDMLVFQYNSIPENKERKRLEKLVSKYHRENIIIYTDDEQTQQVWQWVRREPGSPLRNRERRYTRGQSGQAIAQILAQIAFSLDEEDDLTIVDVTSRVRAAFDVEKVTKKFYDRFKREHDAFLSFIEGIPDDEFKRWYASVMLNRLMFIYFVQKKGFLNNDRNYLRNKLDDHWEGNFYHDFLIRLFFEGFALRDHTPEIKTLLGDVPYLNGGLFLPHQVEETYGQEIAIGNEAFAALFDFFDDYQWHLDERPLRDDNEINPDVLGYIFEKYINQKQMGAYYTKEDITEYISKNTVIPFLLDEARKAVKIAFEPNDRDPEHSTIWDSLRDDPDRYIYPAIQHGYYDEEGGIQHLPENIAVGIDDVGQRGAWNTPTPPEYGLPTEIWRETVARRQRYEEVRGLLEHGEVTEVNDLITYNLDIQQFAQDVIAFTDSPALIRALWKSLNSVTILDPTCGSGAFLFAALNILEPLYDACLERMDEYLSELKRLGEGSAQRYRDFRETIERMEQHPNRRYFILKSIIVNNLFGVDIMEEAVEIAKLRLFLKLVAQVEDERQIEPLPDIDFNIRAGNTLVGFATRDEVQRAMTVTSEGQGRLVFGEDQAALDDIERKAQDVDRLFSLFRQQQTELGGEVNPEDKQSLIHKLQLLAEELNSLLARQYGVNPDNSGYEHWLKSHQPFHWFVEFHGVLKNGGFDVIIGNPPYVEYHKVRDNYTVLYYSTEQSNNLYSFCIERSTNLLGANGRFGMIVPLSGFSTNRMKTYQELVWEQYRLLHISYYSGDAHPSVMFNGVKYRLCIVLGTPNDDKGRQLFVTKYQRWYAEERNFLFPRIVYTQCPFTDGFLRFAKLDNEIAIAIINGMLSSDWTLGDSLKNGGEGHITYHRSPTFWIRAMDFEPYFKSETRTRSLDHIRDLYFDSDIIAKRAGAVLTSTCFYIWFTVQGNCRNITGVDVEGFPVTDPTNLTNLEVVFSRLMTDLQRNSRRRVYNYRTGPVEYDEFYQTLSKPIMDEIDQALAQHYGFTDEELDFIINYDIKYRMGDELSENDDEGEE